MAPENEMHLTCDECSTVYRLDPVLLTAEGRVVRCTQCNHTWHQDPPEGLFPPPAPAEVPDWMHDDEPEDELAFQPTQKGQYFLADDMMVLPESAKKKEADDVMPAPLDGAAMPVITDRPLGLGAGQFGFLVFVLLCALTAGGLVLGRQKVVDRYPAAVALYRLAHVPVAAPGEGLAFADVAAENRIDNSGAKTLVVTAKMSNITARGIANPPLKVAVKDKDGAGLREWRTPPGKPAMVDSGQSVAVNLPFTDAPEAGRSVVLTVAAKE